MIISHCQNNSFPYLYSRKQNVLEVFVKVLPGLLVEPFSAGYVLSYTYDINDAAYVC
jgi:hypothetical protein